MTPPTDIFHPSSNPCLFDTHAHLTDKRFGQDLDAVLERAGSQGLVNILSVGYDMPTSRSSVELADRFSGSPAAQPADRQPLNMTAAAGPTQPAGREPLRISAAVGLHPHDADALTDRTLDELRVLARNRHVKAVGETGLDFYRNRSAPENQVRAFELHIRLARELGLPLVIHIRDAHRQALEILKKEKYFSGVMHCFSGDAAFGREATDLGLYLSFSGSLTFAGAELRGAVETAPLDRLLVETDCPYLSPRPERGKRNEPAFIVHTLTEMAMLRRLPLEQMARITADNGKKCFALA